MSFSSRTVTPGTYPWLWTDTIYGRYEMRGYKNKEQNRISIREGDSTQTQTSTPFLSRSPSSRNLTNWIKEKKRLTGWKFGILGGAATVGVVFLLNVTFTALAVSRSGVDNGISYLFRGSCTHASRLSLWIHLVINIMSTLLLSASNYTMQVLSSPTRSEVDKAHRAGKWLDIGVPSIRNLFSLPAGRVLTWLVLALSSIPLHLLYNTGIFSTLSANSYSYFIVSESFLTSAISYNGPTYNGLPSFNAVPSDVVTNMNKEAAQNSLIRYERRPCQKLYQRSLVTNVRNVLLVTSTNSTGYNLFEGVQIDALSDERAVQYGWTCGGPYTNNRDSSTDQCTPAIAAASTDPWVVIGHPIEYCMVEVTETCSLDFSFSIMIVVIVANLFKLLIMLLTYWTLKNRPLVTIGDAIASFLETPGSSKKGRCLQGKSDFGGSQKSSVEPKAWIPKKPFWFKAASKKHWIVCNLLCILFVALASLLLSYAFVNLDDNERPKDLRSLYNMGYGSVNSLSIVSFGTYEYPLSQSFIGTVLLANLPQAILSFLYSMYNGLFTCMSGAYEWSLFAHQRSRLRVTSPTGEQRSTYYLQLPYNYAIPLLILSGTLHWFVSQSLFLAKVNVYDDHGDLDSENSITSLGYSCIGIISSIIVGSVAILVGILTGFRRYSADIPPVGSCSQAISAACHPTAEDVDAHLKPVMWGVVGERDGVGHCSFSGLEVKNLVVGELYAG